MSAFLDASAIVAILTQEADADLQAARVKSIEGTIYVSAIAYFEAVISIARKKAPRGRRPTRALMAEAREAVAIFLAALQAEEVPLEGAVTQSALDAGERFGKMVSHPANLNLGDCFAYACARQKKVPLLYKGDDFAKTDIPSA